MPACKGAPPGPYATLNLGTRLDSKLSWDRKVSRRCVWDRRWSVRSLQVGVEQSLDNGDPTMRQLYPHGKVCHTMEAGDSVHVKRFKIVKQSRRAQVSKAPLFLAIRRRGSRTNGNQEQRWAGPPIEPITLVVQQLATNRVARPCTCWRLSDGNVELAQRS